MTSTHGAIGVMIPAIILAVALAGCGYQTGPAGQSSVPVGVGYGTAGSQSIPPPAAGSVTSKPSAHATCRSASAPSRAEPSPSS